MIDLDLFFQFCKRRCHGNQFWAKLAKSPSFGRLVLQSGKQYGRFNSIIFSGNIVARSYANMIKICPVTPEIAKVTTAPFWTRWQKSGYPTKYLSNYSSAFQRN